MRIDQLMSRDVRVVNPNDSIQRAAATMAEIDAGVLPVGKDDRLVGIITDRDIAIRGVGDGMGPDTPVSEVMSSEIKYCFDDEEVEDVSHSMGDIQLRRLPVLNRDKRLVGIVSLGDLAIRHGAAAGHALSKISEPGGQHSQSG